MFNKNIEALSISNKKLAEKLQAIKLEDAKKDIGVFKAESEDLIISYKNVNLHSTIDPVREANTNWNKTIKTELGVNDIQLVFGLGLGYLFKRAFVNNQSKIYLYEPFTDILRFVFEYVDFSAELTEKRVFFTDSLEDISAKVDAEYIQGDKVEFLFLNSYSKLAVGELQNFVKSVLDVCQAKNSTDKNLADYSKTSTINFIENIKNNSNFVGLSQIENTASDVTAVIVSNSDSLDKNIKGLTEIRNNVILFSTADALEKFKKANITPDFVVKTIDDVDNIDLSDYYVISDLRTKLDKNKGVVIYTSHFDYCKNELISEFKEYPAVVTPELIAYHTAKTLGAKDVLFLNIDLTQKKIEREIAQLSEDSYIIVESIDEYANNLKTATLINIEKLIGDNSNAFKTKISSILTTIENSIKEFTQIKENTTNLIDIINKAVTSIDENGEISVEIAKEIEENNQLLTSNRALVVNNVILATYLQNEIWSYTQSYKTGILLSKEDINSNMKLEKTFNEAILEAIKEITK